VTVQLYCDTLDQYLYYLDHGASAVSLSSDYKRKVTLKFVHQVAPKFVNSLVELIASSIDNILSSDVHPSQRVPPGLIEGVHTPEMIRRHFRSSLVHIQRRKYAATEGACPEIDSKWDEIDVAGACLKMGIGQ